jgi:type IV fimbrial biogenesis protein FimT
MKAQSGLTLIELMVTLAVAIVLLAVGIPLFDTMRVNNRSTAEANNLATAINLARSEAVKRGTAVTLCPIDDPANLTAGSIACGSASDWANGWFAYSDVEGSTGGTFEDSAGETLLRVWQQPAAGTTVTGPVNVRYNGTGGLVGTSNLILTLQVDGCSGNQQRQLAISVVGRLGITRVACS